MSVYETKLEGTFNVLVSNLLFLLLFSCYNIDNVCTEKALYIVGKVLFLVV